MALSQSTADAFAEWFPAHTKAFPGFWPATGDDRAGIVPALADVLVKNGIVEADHLFEVTRRMLMKGYKAFDLSEHIKQLLETAKEFHREHYRPEHAHEPGTLAEARVLSKDCPTCGGMGIFLAYRQKSYDPARRDNTITVHCSCPYGRKCREAIKASDFELYRRFYDMDEHPFLALDQYREPPPKDGGAHERRLEKIAAWVRSQPEPYKVAWRAEATRGLPAIAKHALVDDFVAGVISNRYTDFHGAPGQPAPPIPHSKASA